MNLGSLKQDEADLNSPVLSTHSIGLCLSDMQGREQEVVDRVSQLIQGSQEISSHWGTTLRWLPWVASFDSQSSQILEFLEFQNLNSQILQYQGSPDRTTASRKTTRGIILNWFSFSWWSDNTRERMGKICDWFTCSVLLGPRYPKMQECSRNVQACAWIKTCTNMRFLLRCETCTDVRLAQMWDLHRCETCTDVRLAQMWDLHRCETCTKMRLAQMWDLHKDETLAQMWGTFCKIYI